MIQLIVISQNKDKFTKIKTSITDYMIDRKNDHPDRYRDMIDAEIDGFSLGLAYSLNMYYMPVEMDKKVLVFRDKSINCDIRDILTEG
jgi:hypothetical protein